VHQAKLNKYKRTCDTSTKVQILTLLLPQRWLALALPLRGEGLSHSGGGGEALPLHGLGGGGEGHAREHVMEACQEQEAGVGGGGEKGGEGGESCSQGGQRRGEDVTQGLRKEKQKGVLGTQFTCFTVQNYKY
jgi:hypothetical protein